MPTPFPGMDPFATPGQTALDCCWTDSEENIMMQVEQLQIEIESLPRKEFMRLWRWFMQKDWERFDKLPESVQTVARKNFELLKQNPAHPSLHFKKVGRYLVCTRRTTSSRFGSGR